MSNPNPFKLTCRKCNREFAAPNRYLKHCRPCRADKGYVKIVNKYSSNFTRVKKMIIARDGGICQCCRSDKRLHVHHIDGIKKNNNLSNLITLCIQCHMSLHNYYGSELRKTDNIRSLFPKVLYKGTYGVRLSYQPN